MKTYKAKSSAVRAAKQQHGEAWNETHELVEVDGEWGFKPKAAKKQAKAKAERVPSEKRNGNVARCQAIFDDNKKMLDAGEWTRRDFIAAAVASGINQATARTQYQRWLQRQE